MTRPKLPVVVSVLACVAFVTSVTLAAQDRFTLKAPNGVAFSEFKGYDTWQAVAPSQTDEGLKVIVANAKMIDAYKAGIPGNGKPFPEGAMIAKIEWAKKQNLESPYSVTVPGNLKSVALIEKDSKRFPDTSGWGFAQFMYDAPSNTFKPFGTDATFGKTVCYQCHTAVKASDYIFTAYAQR